MYKNLKLQEVLKKLKDIDVVVDVASYNWYKRGEIKKENRTPLELKKIMLDCWQKSYTTYCDGELHICSRSVGIKRNLENYLDDYIKILGKKGERNSIKKLLKKEYINPCDWCHTDMTKQIPRAIQIEKNS